ncbi:MAG: type IV secretory system conjugative DNA transfer family protein, partial [Alphaproteobacteria bacterium]
MSYAYIERRKAVRYLALRWGLCILCFWALLFVFMPLSRLIIERFSADGFKEARLFFSRSFQNPLVVWKDYFKWFYMLIFYEPRHTLWSSFIGWRLPLLPTLTFIFVSWYYFLDNPYDYRPLYFGYGREARPTDLKQMGLDKGKYLFLGNLKGVKMRMPDTRSAFCIGAPASGKTAGVIIPNILMADNACLFIHDPTGQLMKLTSGYRATLGPVYNMDFSKADDPQKGVFYPCWNPLNEANMPPQHAGRDSYIDSLVEFLIPEGGDMTDPYWVKSGRACLTGLTIYIANKVEQAKANDYFVARLDKGLDEQDLKVLLSYYKRMQPTPEVQKAMDAIEKGVFSKDVYTPIGTWSPMPENWIGKEASFGMLLDMLNNWMFSKTKELRKRKDEGDVDAV